MRRLTAVGERVRGYLAARGLVQNAVAVEAGADPSILCRDLNTDDPDPWRMFLYGFAAGALYTRQAVRVAA